MKNLKNLYILGFLALTLIMTPTTMANDYSISVEKSNEITSRINKMSFAQLMLDQIC